MKPQTTNSRAEVFTDELIAERIIILFVGMVVGYFIWNLEPPQRQCHHSMVRRP